MSLDRLQKIIARAGLASRRSAETMIQNGRVRVNGKVVTELGAKADPRRDKIEVDGQRLSAEELVYIVLHKPRGCVATLSDPEGRPTIIDLIGNVGARVHPVGRLDYATSGVLLLTNDGDLTQALLHPKKKVPKTYVVKLDGSIDEAMLERWRTGLELEDGKTLPAEARLLRHEQGKAWIEITLYQGKNQQIRRMAATTGYMAMRLARIAFAGIDHEGLRPGQWRPLSVDEMKKLKANYGEPKRIRPQRALLVQGKKAATKQHADKRRKQAAKRRAPKS
jgi:23S rRNA pseudouridine2605 synthase